MRFTMLRGSCILSEKSYFNKKKHLWKIFELDNYRGVHPVQIPGCLLCTKEPDRKSDFYSILFGDVI